MLSSLKLCLQLSGQVLSWVRDYPVQLTEVGLIELGFLKSMEQTVGAKVVSKAKTFQVRTLHIECVFSAQILLLVCCMTLH